MLTLLSKIPSGVQYIFDDEVRLRRFIEREVMQVFTGWSYAEIILPIFDYADLFALGMGKEQAEMTYRFTARDGRLLALRPEMTSLVARTVATRFRERPRPIRLSYSGEVFRWDEPRGGRQYEFHQLGLEHIGSDRLEADAEVLIVAIEALRRLGLEDFTITLSHVDFFNGVAERLGLNAEDRHAMQQMIDRRESERLNAFLQQRADSESIAALSRLTMLAGGRNIISEARQFVTHARSVAALDDLDRVCEIAESLGMGSYISVDLGDVGGLDYYTGLTFKIYAPGLGTALGRGGRYDQLLSNFGQQEPAVGFSLCLDWLAQLLALKLKTIIEQENHTARLNAENDVAAAFKEAMRLRNEGHKVEIL
jgi:ATP phosphoribosyltransferase regulatory subunit